MPSTPRSRSIDRKGLIGYYKMAAGVHCIGQLETVAVPTNLAGAAVAALVVVSGQTMGWATPLLILPLMLMIYVFYRTWVQRLSEAVR